MKKLYVYLLASLGMFFGLFSGVQAAGLDFTPITSAVDISTVAAAMIALGAIMMAPSVAKWASKKLGTFFG